MAKLTKAPDVKSNDEIKAGFLAKLKTWAPELDKEASEKVAFYYIELLRFNTALNLISVSTIPKADVLHFADSILASAMISPKIPKGVILHDLGSGNGFPGVIFSIMNPGTQVVLVDRDKRKVEFLKHVLAGIGSKNAKTENVSIEDLPAKSLKAVVSRGLAPLPKALIMLRKQVANGGVVFHMKSDGWATELAGVPGQLFSFWNASLVGQYRIPETSIDAAIIETQKVAE